MDFGLQGKAAAVAASSTGLGFAAARELAVEGARVLLCGRSDRKLEAAVASIRKDLGDGRESETRVEAVSLDLCEPGEPERFIDDAQRRFGAVDILVANNGGPPAGPAVGLGEEDWTAGFRRTFLSSQKLAEAAIPAMRERGWGRIIFVTSVSVKQPIEGLVISTAMRSAVVGYAKTLSDELAREGITVNCVAPGSTATDRLESLLQHRAKETGRTLEEVKAAVQEQIPARRIGSPREFAAAVAFLASDRASYITGAVLPVDGGVVRSLT